jgi:hypothetical protein
MVARWKKIWKGAADGMDGWIYLKAFLRVKVLEYQKQISKIALW